MAATVEGAIAYWAARLNGDVYTGETAAVQAQALQSAADVIARYIPQGATDTDIEYATYEQAKWLLGADAEMQANGVQSFNVGVSETYKSDLGRPADLAPNSYKILTCGADGSRGGGTGAKVVWL